MLYRFMYYCYISKINFFVSVGTRSGRIERGRFYSIEGLKVFFCLLEVDKRDERCCSLSRCGLRLGRGGLNICAGRVYKWNY